MSLKLFIFLVHALFINFRLRKPHVAISTLKNTGNAIAIASTKINKNWRTNLKCPLANVWITTFAIFGIYCSNGQFVISRSVAIYKCGRNKHFPAVFAFLLQIRTYVCTKGDRKLANMKLITFVFFFLLIGTLVRGISRVPVSFCLNYFTTTILNYVSNNVLKKLLSSVY